MTIIPAVVVALYLAGFFFNLTGVIGVLRLPDVYCRLHSSAKNATLGSLLIIVGLALREFQAGAVPAALKLLLIGILLMIVAPVGSDALARAAYINQVPLAEETVCDQWAERRESQRQEKEGTDDPAV